jgi:hypothetical protein
MARVRTWPERENGPGMNPPLRKRPFTIGRAAIGRHFRANIPIFGGQGFDVMEMSSKFARKSYFALER